MRFYLGPERRFLERRPLSLGDAANTLLRRMWQLVAYSDTTQTRFFLGLVALLWALALLIPGDSFARPTFFYMAALAGAHAEEKWIVVFTVYGCAALWHVFTTTRSYFVAMAINSFGALLFCALALSIISIDRDPFPAGAASHFGIAFAAVWVLVRTHVNSALGWRHD